MPQMLDIDDFLPDALRYAPNVSDLVAQRCVIAAAREFCERLKLWREDDTFPITAPDMQGLSTYRDADIVSIESARLDDHPLEPKPIAWLDANCPGWSFETENVGSARYVTQLEPNTVTVVPRATGTMKIRLVLKPARDAFSLPAFLLNDHGETISRGAAAKILTEPNSDNPQLGVDHRAWFEAKLDNLAVKAVRGQQGAPLRTRGAYL
ncbi:hypothetical protein J2T08_003590 [Neorhizobium galegae]|uniref:hypothetical protein n=1 Tax=Neorhizobium galegae TaxID=399 RepID=UPI002786C7D4|nr:hypothetical protein [Neorhizobium galegae]MDQ0135669.1 hypothetical protein [Neorhizobium galegae]